MQRTKTESGSKKSKSSSPAKTLNMKKQFTDLFQSLTRRHNAYQVWSDFVTMSACAIANSCDKEFYEQREAMYMECVKRYSKEEVNSFTELFALTVMALEENPQQDFLGTLYGELRLTNGQKGQFFTPYHIGHFMAKVNTGSLAQEVEKQGVLYVSDPCCGAGCLLIAFANAAKEDGVNYQEKIIFAAQDIDPVAGLMCYIQLSLLGCMAYVKIGNSLTDPLTTNVAPAENIWVTPMFRIREILRIQAALDHHHKSQFYVYNAMKGEAKWQKQKISPAS